MVRASRRLLPVLLGLTLAGTAHASHPMLRDEPPATGVPDVALDSLAWLAGGLWTGEALGGAVEETWAPPLGGQMVGVFRAVQEEEVGFYEIMVLRAVEGRLTLRLKHFTGELHGWEERDETVDFPLVDHANDIWYFRGLTIERRGPDAMTVHVRVGQGDEESVIGFAYERAAPPQR